MKIIKNTNADLDKFKLVEDFAYGDEWEEIDSKQVQDSDGFMTDYTWYGKKGDVKPGELMYVFVFGDKDIYRPEDGYYDWEIEAGEGAFDNAQEWFDSYKGFEDEEEIQFDDLDEAKEDVAVEGEADFDHDDDFVDGNEIPGGETTFSTDAPKTPEDNGIANTLSALIRDEFEAIEGYNSALATIKAIGGYEDIVKVITDIVAEENTHVGQLQKALETVSPNASQIAIGAVEAEEQIAEVKPAVEVAVAEDPLAILNAEAVVADADDNF